MSNNFHSAEQLVAFAKKFAGGHLSRFEKDIAVCLTPKLLEEYSSDQTHAYFPALSACVGVQELFCGLHAGRLDPIKHADIKAFTDRFMPDVYDEFRLGVLYHCFRNKVAHLAHPYDVFDTRSRPKAFPDGLHARLTWTVSETDAPQAILIHRLGLSKPLTRAPEGWNVTYDAMVYVSIPRLKTEIVSAVKRYTVALETDVDMRNNFESAMNEYFYTS